MKIVSAVIEKDKEGYFAYCPELQGCYTQGKDFEEALENLKDAIRLHIEDRIDNREPVLDADAVKLEDIEVQRGEMKIGLLLLVR